MGDSLYMYGGLAKRFPHQFMDLIDKSSSVKNSTMDFKSPEAQKILQKVFSARYGGYFGPCILNPGQNMQSMQKLDLMADIIIPGHDPLLMNMNVIPDDYNLEQL